MEALQNDMQRKGTTLYSDTSHTVRMSQRPVASQRHKGFGVDLGSDLVPGPRASSKGFERKSSSQSRSQTRTRTPTNPKSQIEDDFYHNFDDSSEDELDLLSQGSPRKRRSKSVSSQPQEAHCSGSQEKRVLVDGNWHEINPEYPVKDLKNLKFKKMKNVSSKPVEQSTKPSLSATRRLNGMSPHGPTIDLKQTPKANSRKSGQQRESLRSFRPLRDISPNRVPGGSTISLSSGDDEDDEGEVAKTPRPPRPKPRPAYRATQSRPDSPSRPRNDESHKRSTGRVRGKESERVLSDHSPSKDLPSSSTVNDRHKKRSGKATERNKPNLRAHPMLGDIEHVKQSTGKGKQKETIRDIPSSKRIQDSSDTEDLQPFPVLSPLSSPTRMPNPSANLDVVDLTNTFAGSTVRPFPMGAEMLATIGRSPPSTKRLSAGAEDEEEGIEVFKKKKRRKRGSEVLAEYMRMSDDGDNLFIDPNVDPESICPWCDEALPPAPTPHLLSLIAAARSSSYSDRRPTNPLGLCGPPSAFVGVCQRHRFESHQIPRARRKGWPMQIEWDNVGARVKAMEQRLRAIVDDVDEEFLPGAARADINDEETEGRPRLGSVFWKDLTQEVKKQGSRKTAGVRAQFSNFDKTQPGYYGELGYVIIHQTIYDLFPPSSFPPLSTLPLTPTDFIQLVLVPEAAVGLIMEDLSQTREQAVKTLRESAEYGVAMFPYDQDGADGDAGDEIIRERARVRRRQLEEEGLWEESGEGPAQETTRRKKGKAKKKTQRRDDTKGTEDERIDGQPKTTNRSSGRRDVLLSSEEDGGSSTTLSEASSVRRSTRRKVASVSCSSESDVISMVDGDKRHTSPPQLRRARAKPGSATDRDNRVLRSGKASTLSSDTDVEMVEPPPPKQFRGRRAKPAIDVDATPRATRASASRSSSISSTCAAVGIESNRGTASSLKPLQLAREKRAGTSQSVSKMSETTPWSSNLRGRAVEGPQDSHTSSTRHSSRGSDADHNWLLDDLSTPDNSQ